MGGAIGGAFSVGTTSLIKSAGQSAAKSFVKSNLIESGVDTAVDLAQTATQNGGLTPQAVLTSVVINVGGAFIGAPDTPSTTRNQIVDGVTDNKAVKNAAESIKGPYSYLEDSASVADGKSFSAAQKKKIIEENMKKNGGVIKSDISGEVLIPATKSTKGVTPNPSEVNIDHIFPKSAGGSNSYSNAQVLSRAENIAKSNKY